MWKAEGKGAWPAENIQSLHQPWAVPLQAHWVNHFSLTLQVRDVVLRGRGHCL